jgi:ABC-type Fe3+-hydroxamate transport system substrate-binding protein
MLQKTFIDQLGKHVSITFPPQRIISLVPSQTELLADLGLSDRVAGITKFCVHPHDWKASKTIIGGTKKFSFGKIRSINPDLIIGNKEENYQEGIEQLHEEFPVWMSDIVTIQDALDMIRNVGKLTDTSARAELIVQNIEISLGEVKKLKPLRTLYLIWRKPWMAVAPGTFIHEMISLSGLLNCMPDRTRYPELTEDDIKSLDPELILLSSEPFPFHQKNVEEMNRLCPNAKVVIVDGELFSWYGSRLKLFPAYLQSISSSLS